ncbi:uncharacterized protein LOC113345746 [Papaver somniferum]|uniref:uncharacterized protein LOC113345746 n=1 Tax=Papaver somniferum TaxID=3469 RepID=UPI000E6FDA12|nr:uncharacterized protein LOC113345746 [Papaver somniferum]
MLEKAASGVKGAKWSEIPMEEVVPKQTRKPGRISMTSSQQSASQSDSQQSRTTDSKYDSDSEVNELGIRVRKGFSLIIKKRVPIKNPKVEAGLKLRELVNVFKSDILYITEPKIPYSDGVMLRLNLAGFVKKAVHNSSSSSIGNLWILWSEDIEEPVVLNMTRHAITKKGGRETLTSRINEFSYWMEENSLFEADSLGSKFTWTNGQSGVRRIISKLDRAIINEPWEVSDHSTLIGYPFVSLIPRRAPFRIQKVWFTHPDFLRMVEASWNAPVYGNPDFIFPFKLKKLKVAMKLWNQQVFGNVNARLKQAQLKLEVASRNSDEDPFDTFKQNVMKDALVDVHEVRMQQHIMLKQKSRNKWILKGSSNISYFHSTIKTRRSANTISELVTDDESLINEPDQLRDHVVSYYENKFNGEDSLIEDHLFEYDHNSISFEERQMLDSTPSMEEIKAAVFDLGPDSAPGPDGLLGCFYRHCWDLIHQDLAKAIIFCWNNKSIPNGDNSSLILLMAKGRNIHENISLASEMVNEMHIKRKDGNLGLKLDISQAFDMGNMKSLTNLVKLLEDYQRASGQRVCREKSKIYFGGGSLHRRKSIVDFLGVGVTYFPDHYLGVKLMPGVVKYTHISNVVDKLKDQLSFFKGKMLSFQDRVVLVKTVLSIYAIHNMAVYKWPLKFVKQCERVIRNFLWSGDSNLYRTFLVGYDKICNPVREGGLGLTSLRTMNKALIMKLWWSIKASTKKWARFLDSKFTCRDGRLKLAGVKSSILPGIRWVHQDVIRNTKSLIGDERSTSLFYDVWYGTEALEDVLNRSDLDRHARVSDIFVQDHWQLEGVHLQYLTNAGVVMEELPRRRNGSDKKIWMPDFKGLFSVKSARELVRIKYPIL